MNKEYKFFLPCDCGCSIVGFYKGEEDEMFVMQYSASFYAKQPKAFQRIKNVFKFLMCLMKGKDYDFYDMVISQEDFLRFKEFINTIK